MQKRRIYAHKHLDFYYKHLLVIDSYGIEYKKQKYNWNKIEKIKVLEPGEEEWFCFFDGSTFERLKIYLSDGKTIKINSRVLVEKNKKRSIGFIGGKNGIYEELKALIISKHLE